MESISHSWSITKLVQNYDSTKTVKTVNYRVTSTLEELTIFSDGYVNLDPPTNQENFIPYENLTEEEVLGWVLNILGPTRGNHELCNEEWLYSKKPKEPTERIEPLPWENN